MSRRMPGRRINELDRLEGMISCDYGANRCRQGPLGICGYREVPCILSQDLSVILSDSVTQRLSRAQSQFQATRQVQEAKAAHQKMLSAQAKSDIDRYPQMA